MVMSDQVHTPAALPPRKISHHRFYWRLGGSQSWSELCVEERCRCLVENWSPIPWSSSLGLVTKVTELCRSQIPIGLHVVANLITLQIGLSCWGFRNLSSCASFNHSSIAVHPLCWALASSVVSYFFIQTVGLLGRAISPSQGRYLSQDNTDTE
jgi:hypothetical protein